MKKKLGQFTAGESQEASGNDEDPVEGQRWYKIE